MPYIRLFVLFQKYPINYSPHHQNNVFFKLNFLYELRKYKVYFDLHCVMVNGTGVDKYCLYLPFLHLKYFRNKMLNVHFELYLKLSWLSKKKKIHCFVAYWIADNFLAVMPNLLLACPWQTSLITASWSFSPDQAQNLTQHRHHLEATSSQTELTSKLKHI